MNTDLPAILGGTPARPEGPPVWPLDEPAVGEALQTALADGSWGRYHGPHAARLAEELGAYHGCEHVVLCASGTAAVELALRGVKVGAGDEVILAAYDFKANFQNVLTLGAVPVLVDVRADNWNVDAGRLEAAISPATRAVLVSHLHGGVVEMPRVVEIARLHGVAVVEDACQSPGAVVFGRKAGMWGDVGVLSFGGSKLLTSGRGGVVLTNDAETVQRIRLYTQRGNEAYPLSELQAAVLVPQLGRLDERNAVRAERVRLLTQLLEGCPGLVPFRNAAAGADLECGDTSPLSFRGGVDRTSTPGLESTSLEKESGDVSPHSKGRLTAPSYFKLGLQYDAEVFDGLPRDVFAAAMRAEGVAIDPGFRSLAAIHSRRRFRAAGELVHAAEADRRVLTLHHPVLLGSEDDVRQIVQAVEKIRAFATEIRERLADSDSLIP